MKEIYDYWRGEWPFACVFIATLLIALAINLINM